MAAMGLWLGAAIDTYGRFFRRGPSFRWFVAINDILFWLIQGLFIFYVLLHVNQGEIRIYIFFALLCGYAAYQALFRKFYQAMLERIVRATIAFFRLMRQLVFFLIINPTKWLLNLLYRLCMMLLSIVLALLHFIVKIGWKPVRWFLFVLYRLLGIEKTTHYIKATRFFTKIRGFLKRIWKKKDKG